MKLLKKVTLLVVISSLLFSTGCKKALDEVNHSNITFDYFKTPGAIDGAIIAAYSNLRNWYCQEGMCYNTMIGTDEHIPGFGTSGNFHTYTVQTSDGAIQSIWDWSYRSINNCNGVLEFAPSSTLTAADKQRLMAEAKFMRAYYYFMLVQTFGNVSLTTKFVTEASTAAVRDPMASVYDLIVKDLKEASTELPDKASPTPGRAAKGAALFLLSKVYLTRGWSAAKQANDFTDAYNTALQLINNKSTYGSITPNGSFTLDLEPDFADIWKEGNEYGREVLFVVDRNGDPKGSETTGIGTGNPGGKFNGACFYQRPNYPIFTVNVNQGITGAPTLSTNPVDRDVAYGRPFGRVRPSNYTLNTAFADKVNDSRYYKTFQTVYIFNRPGPLAAQTPVNIDVVRATSPGNPTGPTSTYRWIKGVDTAIVLTGLASVTEAQRKASKAYLMTTNQYDGNMFPSMKKHDDVTRPHTNDASDRPFPLMRFAEAYLIAAEAAQQLNDNLNAAKWINVIRARAGAILANPGDMTIDYILDERTRELFGEWMRWYDLVRTKRLEARLALYNPISGFNPLRDYLRPIPQSQINLVTSGPKYPQNPLY